MPKQSTRSARCLGVFSNNSELRRSFLNLGRLIDFVFRNHVSLAENLAIIFYSESVKMKKNHCETTQDN